MHAMVGGVVGGDEPAWRPSGIQQRGWCGRMEHVWLPFSDQDLDVHKSVCCHQLDDLPRAILTKQKWNKAGADFKVTGHEENLLIPEVSFIIGNNNLSLT